MPFADHNAMLDPSCPDITARVLEALGHFGYGRASPGGDPRASSSSAERRSRDCGWPGRWGVNYLYGTWQVLQGLRAIGLPMRRPDGPPGGRLAQARPTTERRLGRKLRAATTTRSMAGVGDADRVANRVGAARPDRGRRSRQPGSPSRHSTGCCERRHEDGDWHEEPFTGTGFPKVFYLKYHMYSLYFPLMALSRFATAV